MVQAWAVQGDFRAGHWQRRGAPSPSFSSHGTSSSPDFGFPLLSPVLVSGSGCVSCYATVVEHDAAGGKVRPTPPCALHACLLAPPPCRGSCGRRGGVPLRLDLADSVHALGEKEGFGVMDLLFGAFGRCILLLILVQYFPYTSTPLFGVSQIVKGDIVSLKTMLVHHGTAGRLVF